ncbi:DNA primase [Burkholderia ubonensis]|nr:DNA primase [Burkholderia ubonensis]
MWLYKAGISNQEIEALGFFWNPRMQRVVLPVRDDLGVVVYWQARTLDKANPRKYLNPHVDKRRLVARYGDGPLIVLTEDLLSAYKVATRGGVSGWCLLGTKISDWIAAELIRSEKPVAVWLDPDTAGQTNAAKIIKQLRAYGIAARNVVSSKDPKLLQREEIKWSLEK